MSTAPCHLSGLGVLVTRPAQQADPLCELIEQAHGRPIRLAAIEIKANEDTNSLRTVLRAPCDLMIFISVNAVEYAFPLLPEILPADMAIAAVGRATAERLEAAGLDPTLVPESRFDTEGLLALPGLQDMQHKRVVIVRGGAGRPLLGDTLSERGAQVVYADVYSRSMPRRDTRNLIKGWKRMVHVVTATSNEVLDNLFTMLGDEGRAHLTSTPLVVASERMAEHAKALGCRNIQLAESALDAAMLSAVCELARDPAIKTSIW